MPKLVSSLMRAQIALLNPLLRRMDLNQMRKLQDGLGALGLRALADEVHCVNQPFENFEAAWALPKMPARGKAVLYLHGGAYTAGSLTYAKGFGGVLAERTGYQVLCAGYRLAPEDPFPAALEDALAAYRLLISRVPPEGVALVGESAGGGLCYCLALKLKELGLPQPACIATLSPWTDLSLSGKSFEKNLSTDPLLCRDSLAYSAQMYADGQLNNPLVSPLFGELTGIAPSLMFVGTHEVLQDDSVLMAQKLLEQGCACELHVEEGMWHVYVLYGIPEAREAIERMRAFIWEATGHERKAKA